MPEQILCTKCGKEWFEGKDDGPDVTIEQLRDEHFAVCGVTMLGLNGGRNFMIYKKHLGLGVFDGPRYNPDRQIRVSEAAWLSDAVYFTEEKAEGVILGINQWLLGGKGSARPGEIMINALKPMNNHQRERVFVELRGEFCINCGKHTGQNDNCHCTSDG